MLASKDCLEFLEARVMQVYLAQMVHLV